MRSTAFGVSYRVIGGLGSDTINVAGDVVEDIVVRELEGASGAVNHLVTSAGDLGYDGLIAPGIDVHVAGVNEGIVVIDETGGVTAVREGGAGGVPSIDSYGVRLSQAPVGTVYVTVSAARSGQQEAGGIARRRHALAVHRRDGGGLRRDRGVPAPHHRQRRRRPRAAARARARLRRVELLDGADGLRVRVRRPSPRRRPRRDRQPQHDRRGGRRQGAVRPRGRAQRRGDRPRQRHAGRRRRAGRARHDDRGRAHASCSRATAPPRSATSC